MRLILNLRFFLQLFELTSHIQSLDQIVHSPNANGIVVMGLWVASDYIEMRNRGNSNSIQQSVVAMPIRVEKPARAMMQIIAAGSIPAGSPLALTSVHYYKL